MAAKYPRRVVLGVGYPWNDPYPIPKLNECVMMYWDLSGGEPMKLNYPVALEGEVVPIYRLVLERVDAKRKRK